MQTQQSFCHLKSIWSHKHSLSTSLTTHQAPLCSQIPSSQASATIVFESHCRRVIKWVLQCWKAEDPGGNNHCWCVTIMEDNGQSGSSSPLCAGLTGSCEGQRPKPMMENTESLITANVLDGSWAAWAKPGKLRHMSVDMDVVRFLHRHLPHFHRWDTVTLICISSGHTNNLDVTLNFTLVLNGQHQVHQVYWILLVLTQLLPSVHK